MSIFDQVPLVNKCISCKRSFSIINEANHEEDRCIDCQTKHRKEETDYFHKIGKLPVYGNGGIVGWKPIDF